MRIASWNGNSVRMRLDRLVAYLQAAKPDVLCLQEIKCTGDLFPAARVEAVGYRAAVFGQKTYNGVALLAREEPAEVSTGLADGVDDPQARIISATVLGVRIHCVYVPNGQSPGTTQFTYKLDWYQRLRRFLEKTRPSTDRWAVCGDFNVAPDDRDVWDARLWEGKIMATPEERAGLKSLLDLGLEDSLRLHHPEGGLFSFWDYRAGCFARNLGLRIDHLLLSAPLAARCIAAGIDREVRKGKQASDHAPVWAEVAL